AGHSLPARPSSACWQVISTSSPSFTSYLSLTWSIMSRAVCDGSKSYISSIIWRASSACFQRKSARRCQRLRNACTTASAAVRSPPKTATCQERSCHSSGGVASAARMKEWSMDEFPGVVLSVPFAAAVLDRVQRLPGRLGHVRIRVPRRVLQLGLAVLGADRLQHIARLEACDGVLVL